MFMITFAWYIMIFLLYVIYFLLTLKYFFLNIGSSEFPLCICAGLVRCIIMIKVLSFRTIQILCIENNLRTLNILQEALYNRQINNFKNIPWIVKLETQEMPKFIINLNNFRCN